MIHASEVFGKPPNSGNQSTSAEDFAQDLRDVLHADWPEPEDLGAELPPVPPFDLELLPASLQPLVADTAERMDCVPDFAACAAVIGLAAVTNRRAQIQPKTLDSGWLEQGNLWGLVVAPPGSMKTPAANTILDIVRTIEKGWVGQYEQDKNRFALDREEKDLQVQAWRETYKKNLKAGHEVPDRPDDSQLSEPQARRLLTSDPTEEKLHELLSTNAAGMTLWRDEISGWVANLGRDGRESERAFFLQCWSGNGYHTIDRIVRGSIYADHLCLSMFGTIQPGLLPRLFAEEFKNGVNSDGLVPRFQIVVYPDMPQTVKYVDRPPNSGAIKEATAVYQRLAKLSAENPQTLRFDKGAQELFADWYSALRQSLISDDLSLVMRAHLSKYPKLMPTLALLLSRADNQEDAVPLLHTEQAVRWCNFLEAHAQRLYSRQIDPAMAGAIRLAREIRKGFGGEERKFTVRAVYRNHWSDLEDADQVRAALQILQEYGWVRAAVRDGQMGRPAEEWEINPRVKEKTR
jgi:putative DNA primase/helicase